MEIEIHQKNLKTVAELFFQNKINHSGKKKKKKEITTKSLTQPCLIKVYVSLLSQEHFQNYCKLYNRRKHADRPIIFN